MIAAVIFSRDRAMQLDLLLSSLDRNASGVFRRIYVLYRATTEEHEEGYKICSEEHPLVKFVPDGVASFQVTATLLAEADFGCYFTDDSVFYRPIPTSVPQDSLHGDVLCFSLRLGRNTTWCYPHGRSQELPKFSYDKSALVWDWTISDGDFGYPASVDGHIFRGSDVRIALHDCPPEASPNQVEDHLVQTFGRIAGGRRFMSSYEESCLVGLPLNVVTQTHRNRNGERYPHSADGLLGRYLGGQRIDLDALDFSNIRGAHQEIPLLFR